MSEVLERQVKARFTEEEHEQLTALAGQQGVTLGRFLRDVAIDRLRVNLTHGERLQLTASLQLQAMYIAVVEASLAKQMTSHKLTEIQETVRINRPDLLLSYIEEMGV